MDCSVATQNQPEVSDQFSEMIDQPEGVDQLSETSWEDLQAFFCIVQRSLDFQLQGKNVDAVDVWLSVREIMVSMVNKIVVSRSTSFDRLVRYILSLFSEMRGCQLNIQPAFEKEKRNGIYLLAAAYLSLRRWCRENRIWEIYDEFLEFFPQGSNGADEAQAIYEENIADLGVEQYLPRSLCSHSMMLGQQHSGCDCFVQEDEDDNKAYWRDQYLEVRLWVALLYAGKWALGHETLGSMFLSGFTVSIWFEPGQHGKNGENLSYFLPEPSMSDTSGTPEPEMQSAVSESLMGWKKQLGTKLDDMDLLWSFYEQGFLEAPPVDF